MQNTPNYNLNKPDDNDTADISLLNSNADTIDAEIKKTNDRVKTDVPAGAKFTDTIYVHPDNATTRHVTDAEKTAWNGKADGLHKSRHATGGADALTPADIGAAPANLATNKSTATDGQILTSNGDGTATFKDISVGLPPSPVTNLAISSGDANFTLTYTNPTEGNFSGVRLVYKLGSYPTKMTDGTVVEPYNSGQQITGVINDANYYCRMYTYDTDGDYNDTYDGQTIIAKLEPIRIYGVKIDTLNSNPETALTYTNDSIGFIPASGNNGAFSYGSWEDKFPFNQIKPCLYKNGVVNYYLNPNDYTKKLDGTASDITSGNDGDVMVEFPKIYWKFETVGTDLYVRYSKTQINSTYKCLAHTRGTTKKDKCYLSAYMGYNLSSKLRSLSGKTPTATQTISQFRTQAQANGVGYDQMAYYQLLMLQVLFIVMFKSRDSQTALGRGYVDGNSAAIATGGTNQKGLFYGETTGKLQNKFCGVEDFWGNIQYWIDGFFSDANRNMLIGNQNFNDTGSGYTNYGQGATADLSGYISTVQGATETGFIVKAISGSTTTYYCDNGNLYASQVPYFGGDWSSKANAGAFRLFVTSVVSYSGPYVGGRLLAL